VEHIVTAGIDLGTAAIKVAFCEGNDLLWARAVPTMPQNIEIAERLLEEGLSELSLGSHDIAGIAATGYGKNRFSLAEKKVDEISANAMGARVLSDGRAKTVINIGGQDIKIIRISPEGRVTDFKMNDKCAAGTGRFFEIVERILNIPLREFAELAMQSRSPVLLNSTCAVFAESEIVSLIYKDIKRQDILAGIHKAVAKRIVDLIGALPLEDEIYLDGGPAANEGILLAMKEELMRDVMVLEKPQFTVAIGASLMVKKNSGSTL
jgi:predicted CoA-substrate-specific enzyme activase